MRKVFYSITQEATDHWIVQVWVKDAGARIKRRYDLDSNAMDRVGAVIAARQLENARELGYAH